MSLAKMLIVDPCYKEINLNKNSFGNVFFCHFGGCQIFFINTFYLYWWAKPKKGWLNFQDKVAGAVPQPLIFVLFST